MPTSTRTVAHKHVHYTGSMTSKYTTAFLITGSILRTGINSQLHQCNLTMRIFADQVQLRICSQCENHSVQLLHSTNSATLLRWQGFSVIVLQLSSLCCLVQQHASCWVNLHHLYKECMFVKLQVLQLQVLRNVNDKKCMMEVIALAYDISIKKL